MCKVYIGSICFQFRVKEDIVLVIFPKGEAASAAAWLVRNGELKHAFLSPQTFRSSCFRCGLGRPYEGFDLLGRLASIRVFHPGIHIDREG